jgi:phosphatidylglycerol lysyltransferase
MRERLRHAFPALIGLVLFFTALEVLRRDLHAVTLQGLVTQVIETPPARLAAAMLLTAVNYLVLTGYDFIAFAYIKRRLAWWRIAIASFLAYAIANNVGFAVLSGASVRYRFYTRWRLTGQEISRIIFSYTVTFWLGLLALGGLSLALLGRGGPGERGSPLPAELDLPVVFNLPIATLAPVIGWLLVATSVGYVVLTAVRSTPLRIRAFELPLPSPRLALAQLTISAIDWALAAAVLYVLLPIGTPEGVPYVLTGTPEGVPYVAGAVAHAADGPSFLVVLGAFLVSQLLGLASHVPGGVGVFEGLMTLMLRPYFDSSELLPALVVYRAVYYLLPLLVALVGLVADEIRQRRLHALRATRILRRVTEQATPSVIAIVTFLSGVVLLFSSATPAAAGRLAWLARLLPLGIVEMSHFVGSLVGVALLLLSQGLSRRLDAAYYLASIAMSVGIATSLLKGVDYEEAAFLALVLFALTRARGAFDRKAALFETRFSAGWIAAVIAAVSASVWLGLFAFKHVEYSSSLWWEFELTGEAPRFLRASVGAATVVLLFALMRLLRHAPHEVLEPTEIDLRDAQTVIRSQNETYPYLAFLRDKGLLFSDDRTGFVMYGVQGRTWVAMGDPVGPAERVPELIRAFLERCDDFGGTPVFYEVGKDNLHHYADYGLSFLKLGEEARVDLEQFTFDGGKGHRFRQALRRLEKDEVTFRIVPVGETDGVMDQLERVSDDWLRAKAGGEKGFSLGFFDRGYLARFPIAVIERAGEVQAFANLWLGEHKEELSVDLMRYHTDAPKGIMETLFVHIIQWGKQEGYRWFALGMAPMSGFEQSPIAPLWTRLGRLLYEHGEALYHFQGLRAYKEKFDPIWQPNYLAYPGGLTLPRILADVSALVAGGYRRIFLK